MSYITQTCADLVHAQAQQHHLALHSAAFKRDPANVAPGLRISLEFAQRVQATEVKRIAAILAVLPAANDMDMHIGAA